MVNEAVMLELVPVGSEQVTDDKIAGRVEIVATQAVVIDRVLTLEEEAGLTDSSFSTSRHPSSKLDTEIPNKAVVDKELFKPVAQIDSAKHTTIEQAKTTTFVQSATVELNQKIAAKAFISNQVTQSPSSKRYFFILGVAGILLTWLGLQSYGYIKALATPDVLVVKPGMSISPQVAALPATVKLVAIAPTVLPAQTPPTADAIETNQKDKTSVEAFNQNLAEKPQVLDDVIEAEPKKSRTKKTSNSNDDAYADSENLYHAKATSNIKSNPVVLMRKTPLSIDPVLLAAYQAFTRGENIAAQQQYQQVLQHNVRSVDALLGMAAIAQRQGREADAISWSQQVLEIDPKNTIALSITAEIVSTGLQANTDIVDTESRIKNMIAQQPDAANLHASLGHLYAKQSQWPSAQQAYFEASRLTPNNADYAFNLAISLDQMGKSSLALQQYQRALTLLNASNGTSPDRVTLEARIQALQY